MIIVPKGPISKRTGPLTGAFILDANVFVDSFDKASPSHKICWEMLDFLAKYKIVPTMPMHGWFEVQVNLKKIQGKGNLLHPIFDSKHEFKLEYIHIDDVFLANYANIDVEYIKAGDHIYLVVAKKHNKRLVTSDEKMLRVAKRSGIQAMTPAEYMASFTAEGPVAERGHLP